ncbi:glycosyltransferase family 4 protein [bacterium]|nr:glycosyltransferase family 4 protein [bacterium]
MKIVHISTHDSEGGAARAAYRLHTGLNQAGHDSQMLVRQKRTRDPKVKALQSSNRFNERIRRFARRKQIQRSIGQYATTVPSGYEPFHHEGSHLDKCLVGGIPECDIINLHYISEFVDFETFFTTIANRIPVAWRLPDLHALTGGCHFDMGCGKHTHGCGSCPQLGSKDQEDLSAQIWKRRLRVLERINSNRLHFIALNHWMAKQIHASPLTEKFPVTIIPNGLDATSFAPRDKAVCRDILGLPQDAKIILFVADLVTNRRKGLHLLSNIIENVKEVENLTLLSIGDGKPDLKLNIPHHHMAKVSNDRLLSTVYSAADIFVIPSLQDNLPNTVLEAMACKTPVAGFNVGGIPDMIRHGQTGLLAKEADSADLGKAIQTILSDDAMRSKMAQHSRDIVEQEYTLEIQAQRYTQLYDRILSMNRDK